MSGPSHRSARRGRAGLTLVEIMIALVLTAMVGVAVAAMLDSVAYATTSRTSVRRINVKQKVVGSRIDAAIRSSMMVLAHDAEFIVLWMSDARPNGKPDLSELRRIERNPATSELWSYRAPANLAAVNDTRYRLSDDFSAITAGLKGTGVFPGERWGTSVTAWSPTLNATVPADATLVRYDLTIAGDDATITLQHAASLRRRAS